jgi:hypothetical protein
MHDIVPSIYIPNLSFSLNQKDTGGVLQDDWIHANEPKLSLLQKAVPNPTFFYSAGDQICYYNGTTAPCLLKSPPLTTTDRFLQKFRFRLLLRQLLNPLLSRRRLLQHPNLPTIKLPLLAITLSLPSGTSSSLQWWLWLSLSVLSVWQFSVSFVVAVALIKHTPP